MANPNYISGRRFEYDTMNEFKKLGYVVMRTAGSHGLFDVIAVKKNCPTLLIQCKRTSDPATAKRLSRLFEADPPMKKCDGQDGSKYVQVLLVKVKGEKDIMETWL